jgi:hypothetical protein
LRLDYWSNVFCRRIANRLLRRSNYNFFESWRRKRPQLKLEKRVKRKRLRRKRTSGGLLTMTHALVRRVLIPNLFCRQQKQAKDDEKAKRDALLAEEAEMARVKQATAEKEANRRREDERVRREAEKRAKLEDQLRKEEERRKRQEREKEAEKAKKQKERDERSKVNRSIAGEVVSVSLKQIESPFTSSNNTDCML